MNGEPTPEEPKMASRRTFLLQAVLALPIVRARALHAASTRGASGASHPRPRPGITGDKVLTPEQLAKSAHLVPLFDGIRAIPQVADGIRCYCGCAELPGFYSLLSCYEGDGMAKICPICQGEGRLAVRLQKEGKSLDEIRAAVDAQFG